MRTTSNPVIRNLLTVSTETINGLGDTVEPAGKKRKRFTTRPSLRAATGTDRPLTVDDVVTKTGLSLAVVVASGLLAVWTGLGTVLFIPALLAAIGLTVYSLIRPRPSAAVTLTYSAAEGVMLGSVTALFESVYNGIATQAVIGTAGVFAGMLIVYKTRVLRVTPGFVRWILIAGAGALTLLVANAFFPATLAFRDGSTSSIIITVAFLAIGALSLLLNFAAADQMIRLGVPATWSWYLAFGLIGCLVWLYLELLWLLSYLR